MNLEKKLQKLINNGRYYARSPKESYYLTQYADEHGYKTEVMSPIQSLSTSGTLTAYRIKLIPHA